MSRRTSGRIRMGSGDRSGSPLIQMSRSLIRLNGHGLPPYPFVLGSWVSRAVLIRNVAGVGFGRRRSLARHNGNAPRFTEARASHGEAGRQRLRDRRLKASRHAKQR